MGTSIWRNVCQLVLILAVFFLAPFATALPPATAAVETNHDLPVGAQFIDLAGTVEQEKKQLSSMTNPAAGWAGGENGQLMFRAGYVPAWEKCPYIRMQFDTAEPNAGWVGRWVAKAAGAVLATVANILFLIPVGMVNLGIVVLCFAFHTNWAAALAGGMAVALKGLWQGFGPLVLFLPVVLMVLLLQKLFKLQILGTLRALVIAVLSLGAAMFLFLGTISTKDGPKPAAEVVIGGVSRASDQLAAAVLSAFGNLSHTTLSGDEELSDAVQSASDRVIADFGTFIWRAFVASTWSVIEFGTANPADLHLTEAEYQAIEGRDEFKTSPTTKTIVLDDGTEVTVPTGQTGPGHDPFGKEIKPGARIDVLMLAYPPGHPARETLANILADNSIDHGKHPLTPITLSGGAKVTAWLYAILFGIVALIFLVFCLLTAVPMLVAQIALTFLFLALPVVLLIVTFVPEGGLLFGERYLRHLLTALGTKVFYGVFVSLVIAAVNLLFSLMGYVQGPANQFWMGVYSNLGLVYLLVSLLLVGSLYYRKKLFEQMQTALVHGQAVLQQHLARGFRSPQQLLEERVEHGIRRLYTRMGSKLSHRLSGGSQPGSQPPGLRIQRRNGPTGTVNRTAPAEEELRPVQPEAAPAQPMKTPVAQGDTTAGQAPPVPVTPHPTGTGGSGPGISEHRAPYLQHLQAQPPAGGKPSAIARHDQRAQPSVPERTVEESSAVTVKQAQQERRQDRSLAPGTVGNTKGEAAARHSAGEKTLVRRNASGQETTGTESPPVGPPPAAPRLTGTGASSSTPPGQAQEGGAGQTGGQPTSTGGAAGQKPALRPAWLQREKRPPEPPADFPSMPPPRRKQ